MAHGSGEQYFWRTSERRTTNGLTWRTAWDYQGYNKKSDPISLCQLSVMVQCETLTRIRACLQACRQDEVECAGYKPLCRDGQPRRLNSLLKNPTFDFVLK